MKIFFDSNVYIAEALLGAGAEAMVRATRRARWRIYVSRFVIDEVGRVMSTRLGFSKRFSRLTQRRLSRRAKRTGEASSRHKVPLDPDDSPILRAAIGAGVDYLVTNDRHLLALNPYEGLEIINMNEYQELLIAHGHLRRR